MRTVDSSQDLCFSLLDVGTSISLIEDTKPNSNSSKFQRTPSVDSQTSLGVIVLIHFSLAVSFVTYIDILFTYCHSLSCTFYTLLLHTYMFNGLT